jgi:large subunit ribosomal protein LP0
LFFFFLSLIHFIKSLFSILYSTSFILIKMVVEVIPQRKLDYRAKLESLIDEYKNILVVSVDNVGSNQLQRVRMSLRGKAVILLGKNTVIRRVLRDRVKDVPAIAKLLPLLVNNIGMVFTNESPKEIRSMILEHKDPAAARVGAFAPCDVFVPPGPTGLDPGQTGFFQALNIATKIVRGAIEIITKVHLIKEGEKVNPSHVSLLQKLDIKPFFYGVKVNHVYEDGALYAADILDLSEDDLLGKFFNGVRKLTCVSFEVGVPNLATLPHSIARAFKKLLAIAVSTDIDFKEATAFKEYLADPAAYAAKHGLGSGSAPAAAGGDDAAEAEPEEESESESSEAGGMGGLFGDEDSD